MTIWSRIRTAISDLGASNPLVSMFGGPPEHSVSFTIAIIALAAKMAKADGHVTRDEVRTLREIFDFRDEDEDDIARVFDLARQDVAGFEQYAQTIHRLFDGRPEVLEDIFEGLFFVAIADGEFHEGEDWFLGEVHRIFNLPSDHYQNLKAQFGDGSAESSPYHKLGLEPGATDLAIKEAYKQIVRENHPDRLRARGVPDEALAIAETRIRLANEAYSALGRP